MPALDTVKVRYDALARRDPSAARWRGSNGIGEYLRADTPDVSTRFLTILMVVIFVLFSFSSLRSFHEKRTFDDDFDRQD